MSNIDKRSDIEGGLSWKFGIGNTDYTTNPAYVYIKTHDLEANHKYEFSFIYSTDYRISLDSISDNVVPYYSNEVELLEGDRACRITLRFETKKAGAHTITLKMGKGYNNKNCAWDGVVLSDLKLYDITNRLYCSVSTELGGTIAQRVIQSHLPQPLTRATPLTVGTMLRALRFLPMQFIPSLPKVISP